ncbi:UDP-glucose 4-epimerase GalE [Brevibacterium aurantiacum]|uniref:UDP-glucose 4-epimerase n=1 Tax=Brevibacterium aurantiacum TaxID=273384 RepID=A0A1D7W800_BREAU|nr:UDP-glucose 4-epimerase GalE [Brevibacterium aurantiacum]AOP54758.1 UDP-glucose 4-epimerase [Brevibacterium aurantiacum]RCT00189.1 UDP-glucose 4-epimerase GalE [Brevibacterium aurantiacum]
MKLVVTGGAGYIGSVVTSQLVGAGHDVTVIDDLSTGHRDAVPEAANFVEMRIHDCRKVLIEGRFDGLLHFAAKSLVGESVEKPELYWENNVVGSFALLEAMRIAQIPTIVFSSTAATYGQPDDSPITEVTPTSPLNAYGSSKLAVDLMLSSYCRAHGIGATSLRYFNVGGARGRFGERHDPETHLIPNLLKVAAGETECGKIFGTDYDTTDGTALRDYLHVVDLGRAHLLALEHSEAGSHRIINLGSGTGYTVRQVLEACRAVTGHPIPAEECPRRAGDPTSLVASNERAREQLGWMPEIGLEQIVADAWNFYRP